MRRGALAFVSAMTLWGWAILHASSAQDTPARTASDGAMNPRAVVDRYCVTCHNQRTKASDLALDGADIANPGANGEVWEAVVRRLRNRSMPPPGTPRPDEATYNNPAAFPAPDTDRR